MKEKIRYILILFVDLILSLVIIDYAQLGYNQPYSECSTLQDSSASQLVIDLTSITEDFSSAGVPHSETEYLPSEKLPFHYKMPVLTKKGRSPPPY